MEDKKETVEVPPAEGTGDQPDIQTGKDQPGEQLPVEIPPSESSESSSPKPPMASSSSPKAPVVQKRTYSHASKILPMEDFGGVRMHPQKEFRWEVPSFNTFSKEAGTMVESPYFEFENAQWCLRLYPNAKKGDTHRRMVVNLVRNATLKSGMTHKITYKISVFMYNGEVIEDFCRDADFTDENTEDGKDMLLDRFRAERMCMTRVRSIKMKCSMYLNEEKKLERSTPMFDDTC